MEYPSHFNEFLINMFWQLKIIPSDTVLNVQREYI